MPSRTPQLWTLSPERGLLALGLLTLALMACGEDAGPSPSDDVTTPETSEDTRPADAVAEVEDADTTAGDVEDVEVLFPGYLCENDAQCSTGYCYGTATPQGAFEPAVCQLNCLQLNDFRRYCNSDRDCCSGRCCIDCGAKEGLCVLSLPGPD